MTIDAITSRPFPDRATAPTLGGSGLSAAGSTAGCALIEVLSAALVDADWMAPDALRYMQLALDELSPPRMARTGHSGGLASWQTRRVEQLVEEHMEAGLSTVRMAEACALSRGHFCRAFKQTYGVPPHRWIQTQRVERAMKLLSTEPCSIADVALMCGFKDQSHFSRVFKAHAYVTPLTWHRRAYYGL
ncbi:transcriptional regulator GlxA family with amidase domain [Luteibacter sp. W1I16]|jgi:AraC family transcriptional regulator|uniref:helix-turn-helix domain-containing protein n=1 Tax=Luteibacter sp. W1I16 TaxID=3373922 RepID=UPI003D1FCABC